MSHSGNESKASEQDTPDLLLAHTSDLHMGSGPIAADAELLASVIQAATRESAAALILAGDTFDHNRIGGELAGVLRRLLAASDLHIVLLPGNHDCLVSGTRYAEGAFDGLNNVFIIGQDCDHIVVPALGATFWGAAHRNYEDMPPLASPHRTDTRWNVVVAHGHWHRDDEVVPDRAWQITSSDLNRLPADYIALGHWDTWERVDIARPAYYSGSPRVTGTINVARLNDSGCAVRRIPL